RFDVGAEEKAVVLCLDLVRTNSVTENTGKVLKGTRPYGGASGDGRIGKICFGVLQTRIAKDRFADKEKAKAEQFKLAGEAKKDVQDLLRRLAQSLPREGKPDGQFWTWYPRFSRKLEQRLTTVDDARTQAWLVSGRLRRLLRSNEVLRAAAQN